MPDSSELRSLRASDDKLSTSLSVDHVEFVLGICEVVWGCGDSIVLGTDLSLLLSEVSLPPLILVSPTSNNLMHTVLLNLTLLSQKGFC